MVCRGRGARSMGRQAEELRLDLAADHQVSLEKKIPLSKKKKKMNRDFQTFRSQKSKSQVKKKRVTHEKSEIFARKFRRAEKRYFHFNFYSSFLPFPFLFQKKLVGNLSVVQQRKKKKKRGKRNSSFFFPSVPNNPLLFLSFFPTVRIPPFFSNPFRWIYFIVPPGGLLRPIAPPLFFFFFFSYNYIIIYLNFY